MLINTTKMPFVPLEMRADMRDVVKLYIPTGTYTDDGIPIMYEEPIIINALVVNRSRQVRGRANETLLSTCTIALDRITGVTTEWLIDIGDGISHLILETRNVRDIDTGATLEELVMI